MAVVIAAGSISPPLPATAQVRALPDTTPPGKPHFDSTGAKVGDQLPNLPMRALDGKPIWLSTAWADSARATLILTSSYTCPKSRATYPQAAELARQVAGHGVRVAIAYVIEAHPSGDPSPYSGAEEVTAENRRDQILCRQPTTMAGRLELANQFARRFTNKIPIFVDEMDNTAWRVLGGGPNMGVLVDSDGIVLARQGWFDAGSMQEAIDAFLRASSSTAPTPKRDAADEQINSTLFQLIQSDKADELKLLLDSDPSLAHRILNFSGQPTLLQAAADNGSIKVATLLVARGAKVNSQSPMDPSPLHLAAERGHVEMVRFLLDHGADVNAKEHGHGPTALQDALFEKKSEVVALLMKAGARTNVYTAASTADLAFIRKAFLEDPTILLLPDGRGRSPLVYAAAAGRLEAAKLLVSLGARDFPADHDQREAAWWAVRDGNLPLVKLLLDAGSDANLFSVSIDANASAELLRALLAHKADANHADDRGMRPLHYAAYSDRPDLMQLLLDSGANIDGATTAGSTLFCGPEFEKGDTPLHVAAENGQPEAVEFLVQHGAKVNVRNDSGRTPLFFAAANPSERAERMVQALIEHQADVNAADLDGQTPLDRAEHADLGFLQSENGLSVKVIELLKKHGALHGKPHAPAAAAP